jgi:hypothetical protein
MIHVRFVFLFWATELFPAAFRPIRRDAGGILTGTWFRRLLLRFGCGHYHAALDK